MTPPFCSEGTPYDAGADSTIPKAKKRKIEEVETPTQQQEGKKKTKGEKRRSKEAEEEEEDYDQGKLFRFVLRHWARVGGVVFWPVHNLTPYLVSWSQISLFQKQI